jgi:hypothetical protein
MYYNPYFSEKEWSFNQAELTRNLEKWRQIKEAKQGRAANKAGQAQANLQLAETRSDEPIETKTVKQVGKEKLGWN